MVESAGLALEHLCAIRTDMAEMNEKMNAMHADVVAINRQLADYLNRSNATVALAPKPA